MIWYDMMIKLLTVHLVDGRACRAGHRIYRSRMLIGELHAYHNAMPDTCASTGGAAGGSAQSEGVAGDMS